MAQETLSIIAAGHYVAHDGHRVDVAERRDACVRATRLVLPEDVVALQPDTPARRTTFGVCNENTLTALARLVAGGHRRVGVLNFASAHHPGGGFERGAQAQEEALARSSALHASLVSPAAIAFYSHAEHERSSLYTDRVILSPDCPVFRDADGRLLHAAMSATFLTCAAPNASALRVNSPALEPLLPATFERRVGRVLAVAALAGCDALVLGAWGCGVFGNEPGMVAGVFARQLRDGGAYASRFLHVDFAVLDSSSDLGRLRAFEQRFGTSAP